MRWKDLTVQQYLEVQSIEKSVDDPVERVARMVMLLHGLTYRQVNTMNPYRFAKLANGISHMFSVKPSGKALNRIGPYKIDYDVLQHRFAQYIEIQHFAKNPEKNLHRILASAMRPVWRKKNDSRLHHKISAFLLKTKMVHVLFSTELLLENIAKLNKRFEPKEKEMSEAEKVEAEELKKKLDLQNKSEREGFDQRYGWQFSAHSIAEYRRISVDEAEELTTIEALNYLQYLRELSDYQKELNKNAAQL